MDFPNYLSSVINDLITNYQARRIAPRWIRRHRMQVTDVVYMRHVSRKSSLLDEAQEHLLRHLIGIRKMQPRPQKKKNKPRSSAFFDNIFMDENYLEMIENFRMSKECFLEIVNTVRSELQCKKKNFTTALSVEKKCAVAIYKLASCAEYRTVGNLFGVHKSTVRKCLLQFCKAIIKQYELCLPTPSESLVISQKFQHKSNIPCIYGAIDGTHIPITPPSKGCVDFANRKGWSSLMMQAVVDSSMLFRYITVRHTGRVNDATALKESILFQMFPDMQVPTGVINGQPQRHFIIGDGGYPLLPWLMKPYTAPTNIEEETFNAYLSKARVVVEHAFGRLKGRWRILSKKMDVKVKFVPEIVLTCCILHNLLEKNRQSYRAEWAFNESSAFQQPEDELIDEEQISEEAQETRNRIKEYLCNNFHLLHTSLY